VLFKTFYKPDWKYFEPMIRPLPAWESSTRRPVTAISTRPTTSVTWRWSARAGRNGRGRGSRSRRRGNLLLDEWPMLGGSLLYDRIGPDRGETAALRQTLLDEAVRPASRHVGSDRQRAV
jgi:hypothetical protein